MSDALEEHYGKFSIGGRTVTNLRFADDIDALVEEEQELTMAQMAHFSFPYYFTIPNSEIRIPKFALRISEFGIRNYEVYVVWASGTCNS